MWSVRCAKGEETPRAFRHEEAADSNRDRDSLVYRVALPISAFKLTTAMAVCCSGTIWII